MSPIFSKMMRSYVKDQFQYIFGSTKMTKQSTQDFPRLNQVLDPLFGAKSFWYKRLIGGFSSPGARAELLLSK